MNKKQLICEVDMKMYVLHACNFTTKKIKKYD